MNARVRAAELYLKALRTGESSASAAAAACLADDVVLDTDGAHMWGNGPEHFAGRADVERMITGIGVMTGVYRTAPWTPADLGPDGAVSFTADVGSGLIGTSKLTLHFNAQDQILHVEQVNTRGAATAQTDSLPDYAVSLVNSALANNTPLIVAYTDLQGSPNLSLRGSTQVYSPTQLSMWVRHAQGGMATALQQHPRMTLMYRDPPARATLTFEGVAHFATEPDIRARVFELSPEVEQQHDLDRRGAALLIDIERASGSTPRGGVRMVRTV